MKLFLLWNEQEQQFLSHAFSFLIRDGETDRQIRAKLATNVLYSHLASMQFLSPMYGSTNCTEEIDSHLIKLEDPDEISNELSILKSTHSLTSAFRLVVGIILLLSVSILISRRESYETLLGSYEVVATVYPPNIIFILTDDQGDLIYCDYSNTKLDLI